MQPKLLIGVPFHVHSRSHLEGFLQQMAISHAQTANYNVAWEIDANGCPAEINKELVEQAAKQAQNLGLEPFSVTRVSECNGTEICSVFLVSADGTEIFQETYIEGRSRQSTIPANSLNITIHPRGDRHEALTRMGRKMLGDTSMTGLMTHNDDIELAQNALPFLMDELGERTAISAVYKPKISPNPTLAQLAEDYYRNVILADSPPEFRGDVMLFNRKFVQALFESRFHGFPPIEIDDKGLDFMSRELFGEKLRGSPNATSYYFVSRTVEDLLHRTTRHREGDLLNLKVLEGIEGTILDPEMMKKAAHDLLMAYNSAFEVAAAASPSTDPDPDIDKLTEQWDEYSEPFKRLYPTLALKYPLPNTQELHTVLNRLIDWNNDKQCCVARDNVALKLACCMIRFMGASKAHEHTILKGSSSWLTESGSKPGYAFQSATITGSVKKLAQPNIGAQI